MNNSPFNKWLEASWRRSLNASEQAELRSWLAAHPECQADWETEADLTRALGSLQPTPVSSNFTARVLNEIDREKTIRSRPPESRWDWLWRPLAPRLALASLAFCAGLFSYQRFAALERLELAQKAQSVATVSEVASLPSPEVLADYDVIRQMSGAPAPDMALLALMK